MSVTAAPGFVASGRACGVKDGDVPDLALVSVSGNRPAHATGVFTRNKMTAAPVVISRTHLEQTGGRVYGVILNSGNANAATGEPGIDHARRMCSSTAQALGVETNEVLVCSTGLIGIPLPIERIEAAVPDLVADRSIEGGDDAATAILTTDTRQKLVHVSAGNVTIGGMAKGSAMLSPSMATMLAVITTDAQLSPGELHRSLRSATEHSFNQLSTDGAQSTNDTVLLLSSGLAAIEATTFTGALTEACVSLAEQMAEDAEGATKVVRVRVVGAGSDDEAHRGARAIATSQLVKCSWYGSDPYWGRIASELGSAGITFDPTKISVAYGDVKVADAGVEIAHDREAVARIIGQRHVTITAALGVGAGRGSVLTNDLTHAYVDENMGTS